MAFNIPTKNIVYLIISNYPLYSGFPVALRPPLTILSEREDLSAVARC